MKHIGPESEYLSKDRLRLWAKKRTPGTAAPTPTPHPWFRVRLHVCRSCGDRNCVSEFFAFKQS